MRTTNIETFPDEEVSEVLGVVRGNTVRARNVGRDFTQSLRQIIGGELKAYSKLLTETRDQAMERMEQEAEDMGADAVLNVRFTTSQVTRNSAEILAYGTAVKLE
ncbi:MAG: YbjQ family protein [Candidatus Nanohaloarchaeota archaeon QJJ-7]|nr:YbjQ family protein [Candidatus Nanohaloarchaeota archaeon QJJ-7]